MSMRKISSKVKTQSSKLKTEAQNSKVKKKAGRKAPRLFCHPRERGVKVGVRDLTLKTD